MPLFDDESPDPLTRQRGICLKHDHHVQHYSTTLKTCADRVTSKSYTAETCHQEIIDLMEALDHCVGDKAFEKLK